NSKYSSCLAGQMSGYVISGSNENQYHPPVSTKKCWLDRVALPQGRDEKTTNQANTLSVQHFAAGMQPHSATPGFESCPRHRCGGQVADVQTLESCREPVLCPTDP